MSYIHPALAEHLRKRSIRPDAYRWARPGTPEARMPGWLDPWMTRVRMKEAAEDEAKARAADEQDAFEREVLALRWEVKKLKLEHELWCFEQKYSLNQPRVPAGSREGGQWTSGSEGGAGSDSIDARPDGRDAPRSSEALAQDRLTRIPATDQPPRSDQRQLEAIANDPLIRAYMDEAWRASNPYGLFPREHGFWISRDDVSGQLFTRPFATSGVEDQIGPGSPPPDAIAFFHTHPYGGIQIGAAPPSPEDEAFAARVGLPGLIQSHVGMYYFGPPLRPVR